MTKMKVFPSGREGGALCLSLHRPPQAFGRHFGIPAAAAAGSGAVGSGGAPMTSLGGAVAQAIESLEMARVQVGSDVGIRNVDC